jgi:hypothetical protein
LQTLFVGSVIPTFWDVQKIKWATDRMLQRLKEIEQKLSANQDIKTNLAKIEEDKNFIVSRVQTMKERLVLAANVWVAVWIFTEAFHPK